MSEVKAGERWITTAEAAEYIGKSAAWLHNYGERFRVPRRKLGRQYRYKMSALDDWLNAGQEAVNG